MTLLTGEIILKDSGLIIFTKDDWEKLTRAARRYYGIKSRKRRIVKKYVKRLINESVYEKLGIEKALR